MDEAVDVMLNRTSIRRFRTDPVDEEILNRVLRAGQRAPSPGGFQAYSMIIIRETETLSRIAGLTGQRFIEKSPVFILVCIDMHRFQMTLDYLGHDYHLKHGRGLYTKLYSVVEASMVAQSMATAALLMGLGCCFVGAIFHAMREVSETLDLPQGVIPLLGVCLGYPEESPPLRPRWPLEIVVHKDRYREPTRREIEDYLKLADEAMAREGYYRKYSRRESTYTDRLKWKTQMSEWIKEHDNSAKDFLVRNNLVLM